MYFPRMPDQNVTAFSDLKIGDIFRLAQVSSKDKPEGERNPRWKVTAVGDPFCSATMEKDSGADAAENFADEPVQFSRQTSVMRASTRC